MESALIYVDGASIKVEKNEFYLLGIITNKQLTCNTDATKCVKNDYPLIAAEDYKTGI